MRIGKTPKLQFKLTEDFLTPYKDKQPQWGPLGYVTYKRTYARSKPDGTTEEYWETVRRVVEGVYTLQKNHYHEHMLKWNEEEKQERAKNMFKKIWEFKFTPPGRGLWVMGTDLMWLKGSAALNNCSFISTEDIDKNPTRPFTFLMDMSMLGVGVGGDTKGRGKISIKQPTIDYEWTHQVPDTREGWTETIKIILEGYLRGERVPYQIDYSQIRKAGTPLKTMGGTAPGPQPLIEGVQNIKKLLDANIGKQITSEVIVDLFNYIGKCVVSGGIRRTAEILFGEIEDEEYLTLKNPEINKEALLDRRWASNNSIFAKEGMDYTTTATLTAKNGEPGYIWLEKMQNYSRLKDAPDYKDVRVAGANPCSEQSLENSELCTLVETYPAKHKDAEEYYDTLSYAHEYVKSVTLLPTHDEEANNVMMRNRRLGISMSGITQAFKKFGKRKFFNDFCDKGYQKIRMYDESFSETLAIPKSVKLTSVKPSGTVSLLAGVTPGIHYPQSEYYIRRIRFDKNSPYWEIIKKAGYKTEKSKYGDNTMVVEFPIKQEHYDRSVDEVSMWEQLETAAQMQYYWADNQVSVTITFNKKEAKDIKNALELYESRLKGVSFLPLLTHGYEQAPYETITKEEYEKRVAKLKFYDLNNNAVHEQTEMFCDGTSCEIKT